MNFKPLDIPEIILLTEVVLDSEITLKFVVFPLHIKSVVSITPKYCLTKNRILHIQVFSG